GETTTEDFTVKVSDNHGGFVDQGVTVTVTGVNDGPTVSAADDSGSVTEDASTPNLTDTGSITFDDVDPIDTHTTSVSTDLGNKLGGSLTAAVTDVATGAGDGTVKWDYSVANSATQYLAEGETTTEDFTVKVSDNHGGFVDQGVTVTVTGVNDGPTVSVADDSGAVTEDAATPNLSDTGAITFDDVDLIDTHTTSVSTDAGNKLGGNLTAGVTDAATGAGDGTVTWNYSVANSATQYLAQGETTKENFTVKVSDNHGGFVDQAVTVTVTGANDDPTMTAVDGTGAVTEDSSTPNLTDTGALTFDDADLIDTHTTSVTTSAANTLGGNLNASVTDTATGVTDGTVTWNYSVANSATQHLAEGETATENFTVKVKDNNGGAVDQNVAVTVTGVNDGPTISAGGDTGGVTEDASTPTLTSTGALTFDDVDLIDTHTASAAAVAGNTLGGGMTASVTDAATGAGDGTVTWNYSIANSAVQSLAAGQTVTEKFNVTVADGHGGNAVRLVTITVTGTNDAPTISTAVSAASLTEDSSTPNLTSTGNIAFDDVDLTDTHSTTVTAVAGNPLGGTLTASVTDPATGAGDGAVTWTYTVANSATQSLADGQTVTDSFNVKIIDTASSSATQTVNANVTGVNDAPTITAAGTDAQASVTEDASTPNLSDTGTIAFNDVDLIDIHTTSVVKASGTLGGALVMGAVAESATTEAGTVGWTYTVANSAVQQLGKGATATETFTVTVNDGKGGTVSQLVTATVTGTNDAPVVDLNGGGAGNDATATATEQTVLVMVPAATVADIDSPNIASLSLTLTARPDGNAVESLSLNAAATAAASGLTVSYTAATGVLSITGSATKATYQTILDGVQYTNSSDAPSPSPRTVNVVVNDGLDNSVSRSVTVGMTAVNDAPVATITPTTYAATEQVAMTLKNTGLSISDVDAASGSMTVTLSVTEGKLTVTTGGSGAAVSNSGTSSVTISGTITQINNLLNTDATSTVSYTDDAATPSASATLVLQVNDNGNTGGPSLTASDTATINITTVNHAPSGTNKTISVTEDVTYTLADFGFTDVDGNNFAGVVINTLPLATAGVLRLGNTALVAGTFVTAAQISDGMLIYSPADNVFGNAGDTSFTFAVRDDGATGGGNVNQDPTPNTMTVDMSSTNFTDTSSSSNVTVQLTGANESIEDNGSGNGDSINLNTATGGATNFTELDFFRSDNNLEMSWTQSGVSRVVTAINQYSPSAYEDFNSFDDGGTYAGYNLGTAPYALKQDFLGTASNEIFAGTAAAESITGAGGNDLLFGNGGDDTLTGGAGTDLVDGGMGNDTFVFDTGDSVVAIGGSGNGGTITGQDVIADFGAGADSLDLQGSPVAAANGVVDGVNSALTIGGNQVSSHSITNGVITFDDAGTFASALSLTSLAQVAAVVQYLRGNDIGAVGATVAFTATIGSLTHAYVYEQLTAVAAGNTANNSLLVDVVGVSLTNLNDLGLV
ncbi:MAG: VCBS domain-containing protein, partial [Pseudomonadota bacterium]